MLLFECSYAAQQTYRVDSILSTEKKGKNGISIPIGTFLRKICGARTHTSYYIKHSETRNSWRKRAVHWTPERKAPQKYMYYA